MIFRICLATLFAILVNCGLCVSQESSEVTQPRVVRVFLLAGQSNMQGQGVVDLDHEQHYNGGKGNLEHVMRNSPNAFLMRHLRRESGEWSERNDVFVWYQTENGLKLGPLGIGFAGYPGKNHFGPELQIGHVLGDAFEEPVLLIKTAWGGKSLCDDFRPPVNADPGVFYVKMLEQLGEAMTEATKKIPQLEGHQLRLEGVFWQQGWNDMVDAQATESYADNLEKFIASLREQFAKPDLPFVYGELGNGGPKAGQNILKFRAKQAEVAQRKLKNVRYVKTAQFAQDANESPNTGHLHHWYGNAESYFMVGDSLGRAMVELLVVPKKRKRILILGDSISIGYTAHVRRLLGPSFHVVRPTNAKGRPENCQGTDHGLKNIDRWLELDGGNWDLIHFNFGLHDLKHVDAKTGKNSQSFDDPLQSGPEEYKKQLRTIVDKLVATDAKLILCTTTPVPEGVKPAREPSSPILYNTLAREVAKEAQAKTNPILVNDLYAFSLKRLDKIQQPKNVHFSKEGSKLLATEVAKAIRKAVGF